MNKYKINLRLAFILIKSNKDFFLFNQKDGKIIDYKLSNNLQDYYKKKYTNFRVIEIIKQQIDTNLIIE